VALVLLLLVLSSSLAVSSFAAATPSREATSANGSIPDPCTLRVAITPANPAVPGVGSTQTFSARTSCGFGPGTNQTWNTTFVWGVSGIGTLNTTGGVGSAGAFALFTAASDGAGVIFVNASAMVGGTPMNAATTTTITVGPPSTCSSLVVELVPISPGVGGLALTTGTSQSFYDSTFCWNGNFMDLPGTNVTRWSNYTWYASPGIGIISAQRQANATFLATSPGTGIMTANATYKDPLTSTSFFFDWLTAPGGGPGGREGQTRITVTGSPILAATASGTPTTGYSPLAVNFWGNATGGAPPYAWAWTFGDGGTALAQNATHTYTNTGATTLYYNASLTVTDSATNSATSADVMVVVFPSLHATASASVSSGAAPLQVTFSGTATGGLPAYTYAWHLGIVGQTASTASTTYTYTNPGTYTVWLNVTDSETPAVTAQSASLTITVSSPSPLAVSVGLSATTITLGSSTTVTPTVTGGGGTTSFSWLTLPPGCTSTSLSPFSCTPSSTGTWEFVLAVSDSLGGSAKGFNNVTVNAGTGTTLSLVKVSPTTDTIGPSDTATFVASGWTSADTQLYGISYTWAVTPAGLGTLGASPTNFANFTAGATPGSGTLWVNGTIGSTTVGTTASLVVQTGAGNGGPVITGFTVSPSSVAVGSSATFTVSTTGGTAPLSFAYADVPTGCTASSTATFNCAPSAAGHYNVTVTVTDAAGKTATATVLLNAYPTSSSTSPNGKSSPSWLSSNWEWLVIAVVVLAAAAIVGLLLMRRRKGPKTVSTTEAAAGTGGMSMMAAGAAEASEEKPSTSSDDVGSSPPASSDDVPPSSDDVTPSSDDVPATSTESAAEPAPQSTDSAPETSSGSPTDAPAGGADSEEVSLEEPTDAGSAPKE
jgi:PKD repeat protein